VTQVTAVARTDLTGDIRHLASSMAEAIRQSVDPEVIILFGSLVEGRAHPESDVDLLVVAPTAERLHLTIRLKRALRPALAGTPLDLFVLTPDEWRQARGRRGTIAWEADQFGVKLYERAS